MIKLVIAGEAPPQPERTVRFEFRRHLQAGSSSNPAIDQAAYLEGHDMVGGPFADRLYPVKIDGASKTVEVRQADFEKLGFRLVVK
jgi:hypothetical protein